MGHLTQTLIACVHNACILAALICHATSAEPGKLPNIVYILADDLGYGDLGCYGQSILKTPQLDAMAKTGMRFTRHYAGSTVCAPSRCVLMTGLHTGHARIRGNDKSLLRPWDITVAKILQDAGYATACVGKWGVGHPPPLDDPHRHGFDAFYGYINMYHAHNFFPEWLVKNGKRTQLSNRVFRDYDHPIEREGRGVAFQKSDYAPQRITEAALQFIQNHRDTPFFLFFAMNMPHANNEAGGDTRANRNGMEVPDLGSFAEQDWPRQEKGFARMVEIIDTDVGRILSQLDELGLGEDTLVMFSSDNGPHQEGGHRVDYFNSNGALRGMKRDLYEGGLRVPMIAHWPGKIAAGSTTDLISGFQDLLPTMAELAGKTVAQTDGISLLPTLMGHPSRQKKHPFLYWEFQERGGSRAIRRGFWKGIQHNINHLPGAPMELYDLSQDPGETNDISGKHAEIAAELMRWMDRSHRERNGT
jgi:arylsulfatase A-like enzyme